MDFENFCKNNENLEKAKELNSKVDVNYEELVHKYKNKSSSELYDELIKVASREKAKGNLNKQQLNNIYSNLAPMMNEKEKDNLKKLIDIIGK